MRRAADLGPGEQMRPLATAAAVELSWIPLGAGGSLVRWCGKVYEACTALIRGRPRRALYHAALEVAVPEGRVAIELTPIRDGRGADRGVVAEGPVGSRWLGWSRLFRYEVRRWWAGAIPDLDYAVGGPVRVTTDLERARRVLELVPEVPTPVWGRDELRTGDMWNSNSLVSWLLVRAGVDVRPIRPPRGGRAPGWDAGVRVAMRGETKRVPPA